MKRKQAARRRDRKSGLSPYARHEKREYAYSPAYNNWHAANVQGAKRAAGGSQHAAR